MSNLNLKPTHKPVAAYYESLDAFKQLGVEHETAVRSAFQSLLETCGKQFRWTLVPEHSIALPQNKRIRVAGPLTGAFLASAGLPKDRLVITHGTVMAVTHLCKILVFGFVGFAFAPYLPLVAGMIGAAALGSWSGTRLRDRVSEGLFRKVFRIVITLLSLRMIAEAL